MKSQICIPFALSPIATLSAMSAPDSREISRLKNIPYSQRFWRITLEQAGVLLCASLAPAYGYAADYTTTQTTSLQAGDTIATTADYATGFGLYSRDGLTLTAPADNKITTHGVQAHGVFADSANTPFSSINATGTTITTNGADADAVRAQGTGGTITLISVNARALGSGAALNVISGSIAHTDVTTVLSSNSGTAVVVEGANSKAFITGSSVSSSGASALGVRIGSNGYAKIDGAATVNTQGDSSFGVWSVTNGLGGQANISTVEDGVSVTTLGKQAYGVGVSQGSLIVGAATVTTSGAIADGARALYAGTLSLTGTSITTNGAGAAGMAVGNTPNVAPAGDINSKITAAGVIVTTTNDNAPAVSIFGPTNTIRMDAATQLTTSGAASHGISLQGGATKQYSDADPATDTLPSSISVSGDGAAALNVSGGGSFMSLKNVTLPQITLGTASWTALVESGAEIVFLGTTAVNGGRLWARDAAGGLSSALTFSDTSRADGSRIRVDAGGKLDISDNADAVAFSVGSLEGTGSSGVVQLGIAAATKNLTVDGAALTTYEGGISGFGDLLRKGSGTLTLTGAQAFGFTGNVDIGSGTLGVGGAATSAADKGFRFSNAAAGIGTLDISQAAGGFTLGTLHSVNAGAGVIALGANTLTVSGATDSDFSGTISGSGGLTKDGAGTLTMTGADAFGYSGTTSIQNGQITALTSATASGKAIDFGANGTLDLTGAASFAAGTINGAGAIHMGANNLTVDGTGSSLFTGTIDGAGGLIKKNTGLLALSGNNAFSFGGDATLQGGVLAIRGAVDPATFSKKFILDGGWLDFSESNVPAPSEGTANNWPNVVITTTGNTSGGVIGNNDNVTYDVAAGNSESVPYHIGDGATPNQQGVFVIKTGDGTLELTNQNYYVGNTRIEGGVLKVRADNNLGAPAAGLWREVVLNGGALEIAASFDSARNIELRKDGAVIVDAGVATAWGGAVGSGFVLTKQGDGALTFRTAGQLAGATVQAGSLAFAKTTIGSAAATAPVTVHAGSFSLSDGTITSAGDAIVADGNSTVTLSDKSTINAGGAAYRVSNGAAGVFNLSNQDLASVVAADGAGTTLQMNLDNTSHYTGIPKVSGGATVAMALKDANSTWTLPESAAVASLSNKGRVLFAAPAGGSYKTLTVNGAYAGGGSVTLNTWIDAKGAPADQKSDRLLLKGGADGVQTTLLVVPSGPGGNTNLAGNNKLVSSEGISLVQLSSAAPKDAFVLGGKGYVAVGDSQYRLFGYGQGQQSPTVDPSQSLLGAGTPFVTDFRLQSAYVDGSGNIVPGGPSGHPPEGGRPVLVPQASSYLTASLAMQNYSAFTLDNLHRRLGDIRQSDALYGPENGAEGFARVIGGISKYRSNRDFQDYGYDFDQDNQALQFGGNWLASRGDDQRLRLGAAVTLGSSKVKPDTIKEEKSKFSMDGRSLALIGTWSHTNGWYVDGILSAGRYTGPVSTDAGGRVATVRGKSYDASVEVGKTIQFASGLQLQPQFQLRTQTLRINDLKDSDGVTAKFDKQQIWSSRLGVLASYPVGGPQGWVPYARVNLMHSGSVKSDSGTVTLPSGDYKIGRPGTSAQLAIGASGMVTPKLAVYGELSGQRRIGSYGFSGGDINLGVRYKF